MNLAEFFKKHPYITQAGVATRAGKYSSPQRLVLIEQAIHIMAQELLQVKIDNTNTKDNSK